MSHDYAEMESSDDEIFFGPLTMKEIKKRLLPAAKYKDNNRQTIGCTNTETKNNSEESIKIIETHSAPDITTNTKSPLALQSVSNPSLSAYVLHNTWGNTASDDSFLTMEYMVANMDLSVSDYKNGVSKFINDPTEIRQNDVFENPQNTSISPTAVTIYPPVKEDERSVLLKTPSKDLNLKYDIKSNSPMSAIETPAKTVNQPCKNGKPHTDSNTRIPVFKTPRNPNQIKPGGSSRKTPNKTNAYQHIKSPIASYIKNSPQVPFVTCVHPKKPLSSSSIPKLVKTTTKVCNKENTVFPALAYRNAKATRVIEDHAEQRLPQSATKPRNVITSLPKPVVMTHSYREKNLTRRVLMPQQEDSFNDLSLHQADVSVCIQKPAFKMP